jgi:hypothetical protein
VGSVPSNKEGNMSKMSATSLTFTSSGRGYGGGDGAVAKDGAGGDVGTGSGTIGGVTTGLVAGAGVGAGSAAVDVCCATSGGGGEGGGGEGGGGEGGGGKSPLNEPCARMTAALG